MVIKDMNVMHVKVQTKSIRKVLMKPSYLITKSLASVRVKSYVLKLT